MHGVSFLQDLAVVMLVAGITTILFHRLRQPVVLGYILAGFLIGPHASSMQWVRDEATVKALGEMGVVFLLFSLGLEFSLRKLKKVGATALIAGGLEIPLMAFLGYQLGRFFDWSTADSVFLGAMISISSTTIIVKILSESKKTKETFSQIIFGILILEDIVAIIMIALLSGLATTGSLESTAALNTLGQLGIFLVVILVGGLIAVPRLLDYVSKFKSDEMLLVTVLGLCLGISLLAAKLGFSVALGAFLIGAVMAETRQIARIEMLTLPIRDMFSAVFFVTIGMLIDAELLAQHMVPILVISATVVVGKILACTLGTFVAGYQPPTALRVGMGLAQIGEFSFILAALATSLGVVSGFLYPIAVAVSVVTTLLAPYRMRSADQFVHWFDRWAPSFLIRNMNLYTTWVNQLAVSRHRNLASKLLRQWGWQLVINLILTAAVFAAAGYFAKKDFSFFPEQLRKEFLVSGLFWLGAILMTLPLYVASFRKLQAMARLIAEISVTRKRAGERTEALRGVVSRFFMMIATSIMFIITLLLSATILPPFKLLFIFIVVALGAALLLRRHSISIYARAQIALLEVFQHPPARRFHQVMERDDLLQEAELEVVEVSKDCLLAHQKICDLPLRAQTGASIVGIERQGHRIINPSATESILPGDRILLLGQGDQLASARALFLSE